MLNIEIPPRVVGSLLALAIASSGLAACGGSSGASNSSANATRPTLTGGTSPQSASQSAKGTSQNANGASQSAKAAQARAKLLARLRALRASKTTSNGTVAPTTTRTAGAFRSALADFASCLRQNGVKVPTPNTSGKGPVLSTRGVNTNTPQYRSAVMKCRTVLLRAFRSATHAQATKH